MYSTRKNKMRKKSKTCLSDFPGVLRALEIMGMDNDAGTADPTAEIPEEWLEKFGDAEELIERIKDTVVGDLLRKSQIGRGHGNAKDDVIETLAAGEQSIREHLIKKLGYQAEMLDEILGEAFEGELVEFYKEHQ